MATPVHDPVTAELYEALAPLAYADDRHGYALLHFLQAIGTNLQTPWEWAHDTDDDEPGFSLLLDRDRCPAEALPWLAQFVGVSFAGEGLTESERRERIADRPLWDRGKLDAIVEAARATLTGNRTCVPTERAGGAYRLHLTVQTSETPDQAVTLAAAKALTPAGIVVTIVVQGAVGTYDLLRSTYASYADVTTAFASYSTLKTNTPI